MLDVVGDGLTVIANTGDDIEIYGAYVAPDPDLVTFWLSDLVDERGWGLAGDTFQVLEGLRGLGVEVWFNLGDRDLAIGLERAQALRQGARLTEAQARLCHALGISATVLPMSDDPVRTRVLANGQWWPFQEFMIKAGAAGPVEDIEIRGVRSARATPEVLDAIRTASAIVIGPSNPVISIGPMLELAELRAALLHRAVPAVAVSPFVHGEVVKGPTAAFMEWTGHALDTAAIAARYEGFVDGIVADTAGGSLPVLQTDVLMDSPEARTRLARETLRFALALG
jgi:LPPG:FO 2-phospho-L-lactate transferase